MPPKCGAKEILLAPSWRVLHIFACNEARMLPIGPWLLAACANFPMGATIARSYPVGFLSDRNGGQPKSRWKAWLLVVPAGCLSADICNHPKNHCKIMIILRTVLENCTAFPFIGANLKTTATVADFLTFIAPKIVIVNRNYDIK